MKACLQHYQALRKEMDMWLDQSRRLDPPDQQGGGEDEANYALAWVPHYLITGNASVKDHFDDLLSRLAGWVKRDCIHGYEGEAEAHHGTEPFLLFLPRYLGLFPDRQDAKDLLEDAAHHIGNWVDGFPEWFDWTRNRFYGFYLGTKTVRKDRAYANELAEHFRFVHIALAAHRVLKEDRYLDWALLYGRRRAQMIADAPAGPLPVMWDADGRPVWANDLNPVHQHGGMAGESRVSGDPLIGAEVLIASGVIYALGDLFRASGEEVFRDAARRIAAPLVNELCDPYGDPAAAAVGYFRRAFGDLSLDGEIRNAVDQMPEEENGDLAMIVREVPRRLLPGVGKRTDMLYWGTLTPDGSVTPVREPSTAALTLAYQMTGEVAFAARALKQAARRLRTAGRALRGGREHADMGNAICSVAAGHGRNWGCGTVTGCYGPLFLGAWDVCGATEGEIEVARADGKSGLPASVLSLVIPPVPGCTGNIRFFNGDKQPVTFQWRPFDTKWRPVTLAPNTELKQALERLPHR